jgi:[acyl-carrier-protein] S-malonyltransferase
MTDAGRACAIAFPGQGIQKPGMATKIMGTAAWHLFDEASEILGYDLGKLCMDGPTDALTQTTHAQVAIFVTCLALWELTKEGFEPELFLGHSLGEITAFGAAGAFSFTEGVRLTKTRGELMATAPLGGMAAVLGLKAETIYDLCNEVVQTGPTVQVANENSPSQTVVSGTVEGLKSLTALALQHGAKKVIPLNVSGPFHSSLMEPVAAEFASVVNRLNLVACHTPVLSNDGETILSSPDQVRAKLVSQIASPVRFAGQVQKLSAMGLKNFVEVGPESLLIPLARRIEPNLQFTLVTGGGI